MGLLMFGANVIDDQKGFFVKIVKISQLLIHVELGNPYSWALLLIIL
jgi:hypothetical protein